MHANMGKFFYYQWQNGQKCLQSSELVNILSKNCISDSFRNIPRKLKNHQIVFLSYTNALNRGLNFLLVPKYELNENYTI